MFIQDLHQIIECVKALHIKVIKDKGLAFVVSDNTSPLCAKG